jgi:hypothetical protein
MSSATANDYEWLRTRHEDVWGLGFCIAFVRGLSPHQVFERLGLGIREVTDPGAFDPGDLMASPAGGGTIVVEYGGFSLGMDGNASRLSKGTALAAVHINVNLDQGFVYAVDGAVVDNFEPDYPETYVAELLPHLEALGMPADGEEYEGDSILAGLALAERVTGVRLTSPHIANPRFIATSDTSHQTAGAA